MVSNKSEIPNLSYDFKKTGGMIAACFFSILAIYFSFAILNTKQTSLQVRFVSPSLGATKVHFGYQELIADSLWLRAIQDFDYCDQKVNKRDCAANNWLFRMLDVATTYAPKFRSLYALGGLALSVIVSDPEGGRIIFERAIQNFPNDVSILQKATYHFLYEVKDLNRASEVISMAIAAGAPAWYAQLKEKVSSKKGQVDFLKMLLRDLEKSNAPDAVKAKLESQIQEIESQPE